LDAYLQSRLDLLEAHDQIVHLHGLPRLNRAACRHAVHRRSSHRKSPEPLVGREHRFSIGAVSVEGNDQLGSSPSGCPQGLDKGSRRGIVKHQHQVPPLRHDCPRLSCETMLADREEMANDD